MSGFIARAAASLQALALTDGQTTLPSCDQSGRLLIAPNQGDGVDPRVVSMITPGLFNSVGGFVERARGNVDIFSALGMSAQPAATLNSSDQANINWRGLQLGINITAIGASTTVQYTIQGKDASGVYYTLLQSAALAATGFTLLSLYPGLAAAANAIANQILPRAWRLQAVIAGPNTVSATGSVSLIV